MKSPEEDGKSTVSLPAMIVFLDAEELDDCAGLAPALRALFAGSAREETLAAGVVPTSMLLEKDGFLCMIMHLPRFGQLQESDPEFVNARLWPDAWPAIQKHRSHLHIVMSGSGDQVARALVLQRIVSTIAAAEPRIIGACYLPSGALSSRGMIAAVKPEQPTLAVHLFVSLFFARERGEPPGEHRLFVSTRGLAGLGRRDMEGGGFAGSMDELFLFVLDLAAFLVAEDPRIEDGHTVGLTMDQKIPVGIGPSRFYPEPVYKLDFRALDERASESMDDPAPPADDGGAQSGRTPRYLVTLLACSALAIAIYALGRLITNGVR